MQSGSGSASGIERGTESGAELNEDLATNLERFLEHLRSERRVSPNTVEAYTRDLQSLLVFAREKERTELTVYDLRGWLGQLARTHAPSSIARKIAALRTWFRFMERRGVIQKNPAAELATPKVRRGLPSRLSAESMGDHVCAGGHRARRP
jgi:integrase/recombinase XerC